MTSKTQELSDIGVSIWLDDLSRERISSGGLQRLIDERNVVGVTTNPTIFANALATGNAYDEKVGALAATGTSVHDAVFEIITADVQKVDFSQRPFKVWVGEDENVLHLAETVIIATGARANYIGLDTEHQLKNKGVSACAVVNRPRDPRLHARNLAFQRLDAQGQFLDRQRIEILLHQQGQRIAGALRVEIVEVHARKVDPNARSVNENAAARRAFWG